MSHSSSNSPSRRGFLTAAIGGAAALPVICSGTSSAATPGGHHELGVVTYREHPDAIYASGVYEPLNASVDCGLQQGAF